MMATLATRVNSAQRVGNVVRISDHLDSSRGVFVSRRRQSSAIGSRTGGLIVFNTARGTRFLSEGLSRCSGAGRTVGKIEGPCDLGADDGGFGDVGSEEVPNSDDADEEDWLVNGEGSR